MLANVAALALLLSTLDPFGWHVYQWFQGQTFSESNIVRDGRRYLCYTSWFSNAPTRIDCDFGSISVQYADPADAEKAQACWLVHEAWHARTRDSNEIVPRMAQYICLHRLGASQEMLDEAYQRLAPGPEVESGE